MFGLKGDSRLHGNDIVFYLIFVLLSFLHPNTLYSQTSSYSEKEIASFGTAQEMEAFQLSLNAKYVRARELSESILKNNLNSIPALFVLSQAMHYGEGNLPRAYFLIQKARHLLESRAGKFPVIRKDQFWYWYLLDEQKEIAREMDLREEELQITQHFDEVFGTFSASQIFPLIKMKRLEEARKVIQLALENRNPEVKERGMNGLCWLEGQLVHREIHYEVCKRACESSRSEVLCSNAGGAAITDFRFEESEKLYLEATKRPVDSYHSPWMELSMVYLLEGRIPETVDALKKAQRQRMARPAYTDQQDQAGMESAVGVLLIALGEAKEAETILRDVYESPDRAGTISVTGEELKLEGAYLLWTALFSKLEFLKEMESFEPWYQRILSKLKTIPLEVELWSLKQGLMTLFSKEDTLNNLIRPYVLGMDSWLVGGVTQIIPSGILNEALREVRNIKDSVEVPSYLDSLQAESELSRGNEEKALALAQSSLQNLPKAEVLLRARVAAIGGEAADRMNRLQLREELWNQTLENFPSVFRLLKLRIPIEISVDQNPLSQEIREKLRRSPRFEEKRGGFKTKIGIVGNQMEICFYRRYQALHHCTTLPIKKDPSFVREIIEQFHRNLMSPHLDLSQIDIHSLGGSPASGRAREQVDEIIRKTNPESLP